ncbi:gluconolactonase [Burkholderiales bacterium JOSHI_001]|nr:gluconolactonase [Burkholderiales bacterium JOSHI_001]
MLDEHSFTPLPVAPSQLGESPLWHPVEQVLYWCDIPEKRVHRWNPNTGEAAHWDFDSEAACIAPLLGGGLLVAARKGLWRLNTDNGERQQVAAAPYDAAHQRFNDGKADPLGRFWAGSYSDRKLPESALYCYSARAGFNRVAEGITNSNGLAFSPDGRTVTWADTTAHTLWAFDFDAAAATLSRRRVLGQWALKPADGNLANYGGRPDGAAMDSEGTLWIAMYEGQRLLRLALDGTVLLELKLPVRCATMPCFGGPDLRTLYITTARAHRPAEELARQPLAGCVLQARVEVPGLPAHMARL